MNSKIFFGNAKIDGLAHRGWFMGHFISPSNDPRCTQNLEIKWGLHSAGDSRSEWGVNEQATTISILIQGRFRLQFPSQEVILIQPGDYALWLPGVSHTWLAEEDSTIISVRYASRNS